MLRKSFEEQVNAFTSKTPLSIAHRLNRYAASDSYRNLPRHALFHWRGLFQPASGAVSGKYLVDERLLPGVPPNSRKSEFVPDHEAILCHCKPLDDHRQPVGSENRYPDIRDRWDLYLLMRHQYAAIAFTGKTRAAIIRRTGATYRTILKLRDWEADSAGGLYRRTRVKSQLRRRLRRIPYPYEIERAHAKTALTHLGYKLPGKPRPRHNCWPDLLRNLGFDVEISEQIEPARYFAMTPKMINDYHERYSNRNHYV